MKALALIVALLGLVATAHALQVRDLRIEYTALQGGGRDPLLQQIGEVPTSKLNLGFDVEILPGVHFDNLILSMVAGQYRMIAWDYRLYVKPIEAVEFGWRHRSTHTLDIKTPYDFPVENGFELQVHLLGPTPKSSWF